MGNYSFLIELEVSLVQMAGAATNFVICLGNIDAEEILYKAESRERQKRNWEGNCPCANFVSFTVSLDREPSVYNFSFFFLK